MRPFTDGTTGQEAVFTNWRGLDIMFHVSTLLPYDRVNPQQVRAHSTAIARALERFIADNMNIVGVST